MQRKKKKHLNLPNFFVIFCEKKLVSKNMDVGRAHDLASNNSKSSGQTFGASLDHFPTSST
jgi:hypothetical protein